MIYQIFKRCHLYKVAFKGDAEDPLWSNVCYQGTQNAKLFKLEEAKNYIQEKLEWEALNGFIEWEEV